MAPIEDQSNSSATVMINRTCLLDEQFLTRMMPPALTTFFIVGMSFNGLTLWIFYSHMRKKTPIDILMLNLCLGDQFFTFTYPLLIVYHSNNNVWVFGNFMCKLQVFFIYGFLLTSVFFLTWISIYRCYMIIRPIQFQNRMTRKCTIVLCVLIWSFAVFCGSPSFFTVSTFELNGKLHCMSFNQPNIEKNILASTLLLFALSFGIPFIILLVSTLLVQRKLANLTLTARSQNGRYAVRMMTIILIIFVICVLPINITRLTLAIVGQNNCTRFQQLGVVYYCCVLAIYANNVLDPFVYFYANTKYRLKLINAIKGIGFCKNLPLAGSSTQSNCES
ncbi:P2Y purinoceptor 4-like [Narcine bancroftii]|uniref:P2Y purinoceptor 4-like n=1 Tax=Narcine bancroftii TaxID=1343680 RepID=UPI0038315926